MANNNRGYSINFATNTITLTKDFAMRAQDIQSNEYTILGMLQRDFPKMKIIHRAPKKASKKAQTKYAHMEKYIALLDNAPKYQARFEMVKLHSLSQNSPASFTKKWFFATFPDFGKQVKFDDDGNITITIDDTAGQKVLEEAERASRAIGELKPAI